MHKFKHHWILEETIYLMLIAVPVAIECFSEGVQIKLSNVFIGRASGNNIALMLSALFIGQTVIGVVTYPIAEGFGIYVNKLELCYRTSHSRNNYLQSPQIWPHVVYYLHY